MNFARPEALLLLVGTVVIVLFYLLRARTRRQVDPFYFLWATGGDSHSRFGRLLEWLEVLLLCAAFAAMVLALAGPGRDVPAPPLRVAIVAVADAHPRAMARARAVLAVRDVDVVTVRAAGAGRVRTLVPFRRPAPGIDWARTTFAPRPSPADRDRLRASVLAAAAVYPNADVAVDWVGPTPPGGLDASWRRHAVATPSVALAVVARGDDTIEVEARNEGASGWRGELAVDRDGVVRRRPIALDPGARDRIPIAREGAITIEVRLQEAGEAGEAREADKAFALARVGDVVQKRVPARIAVITDEAAPPILGALFAALGARLDRERSGVVRLEAVARAATKASFDVAIVLDPPPETDVAIPAIYFTSGGPLAVDVRPPVEGAAVTWFARGHPLLRWVDLSRLAASAVSPVTPAPGVQVLASGKTGPMMLYRAREAGRPPAIGFPFALADSSLRLELPFLLLNALDRWTGAGAVRGDVGKPLAVSDEGPIAVLRRRPGAPPTTIWRGRADEGDPFVPRRPGPLSGETTAGVVRAYANPGADAPAPEPSAIAERPVEAPRPVRRDDSHWFAWIALALLLGEWIVHHYRRR